MSGRNQLSPDVRSPAEAGPADPGLLAVGRIVAVATATAMAVGLWGVRASAFELDGHEVIEATAYKRLLALAVVPGTGAGRLGADAARRADRDRRAAEPPCFDRDKPGGDCGADRAARLAAPVLAACSARGRPTWSSIASSVSTGSASTSWRDTADGLAPVDPRIGVPARWPRRRTSAACASPAPAFDGILRDPYLADRRLAGTYALMHALEDSFSAAHVDRDAAATDRPPAVVEADRLAQLLAHGRADFPARHAPRAHRLSRRRLPGWDAHAPDGRACRDFTTRTPCPRRA